MKCIFILLLILNCGKIQEFFTKDELKKEPTKTDQEKKEYDDFSDPYRVLRD